MPSLGWQELVVILLIVLLLFGAKRLPEIGRSIGRGMREFKRSISGISDEVQRTVEDDDEPTTDEKAG
jgi:sec-independent protein translocase protein TatA